MSKYGLSIWHSPEKAKLDIVFVHGLRGHREKTWTKNGVMWPRDLLAADIEQSRIMSYGHDSGVVHSDTAEITQGSLANTARNLCSLLSVERSTAETAKRPLIFVAHSLGGLVCATAVVLGERNAIGDSVQQVAEHIRGIIFMGTPFAGSNIAKWGELARRIFNVVAKTDKNTLKTLKEDSNDLKELGVAFPEVVRKRNDAGRKINIVFFYEELDTYGQRIVEERSASYPGIGETLPIRANHSEICKFASKDENGYKLVKAKILEMLHDSSKDEASRFGATSIVHNYDKVINQATGGTINIDSQNFNF